MPDTTVPDGMVDFRTSVDVQFETVFSGPPPIRTVPPGVVVGARVRVKASSMQAGLPALARDWTSEGTITELRPENAGVIILFDAPGSGFRCWVERGGGFGYDEFELLPPLPPGPTIWERLDEDDH
jgi:hypothetical protein